MLLPAASHFFGHSFPFGRVPFRGEPSCSWEKMTDSGGSQGLERTDPSHGAMVVGAIPWHARSQLGAVVFLRRGTGMTSSNEETRGPGTEMTLHTNALHSSAVVGKFMVEEDDEILLQVEGPLCNNVLSGSDPHAQLTGAALVDGGCETHRHVSETSEAAHGLETLIPGQHTALLFSSSAAAGKFSDIPEMVSKDATASSLHVEGPLSSNVLSVSRPRAEHTGAALIYGERRTHRHAANAASEKAAVGLQRPVKNQSGRPQAQLTSVAPVHGGCQTRRGAATSSNEETRGPENLMPGLNTNALHLSSAVAGKFMVEDASHLLQVEGPHCNNVLSGSGPHAQLTGAALVHGGCQTHHHAITTTSDEAVGLQQMGQQSGWRLICPGPGEQEDANVLEVEGPLCAGDGGCQTHHHAAVGDATESDSVLVSIFVRHAHVSGGLVLTINLDELSQQMMCLYAQKTNTKLELHYFIYGNKRLEPDSTLLSSGVKADSTIHVCTRLLGGVDGLNLQDYINTNKLKFVEEVPLPNGLSSLQMTILGCQFLSSWIRCFTAAFIKGKSWNGKFELVDFKFVEGHVRYIKEPKRHVVPSSLGDDIRKFAETVKNILQFSQPSDKPKLVSMYPPYVEACMNILEDLVGSTGPLAVAGALSHEYKLFLETLVCCMTSYARERLVIELFRKYEGADQNDASVWHSAINGATCPDRRTLLKNPIFKHHIEKKNGTSTPYSKDNTGTFVLLKDVIMHAADCNGYPNAPKSGDAVELMISDILRDFLPKIIKNLIEKNIDISAELLAAIRCACSICDSSH